MSWRTFGGVTFSAASSALFAAKSAIGLPEELGVVFNGVREQKGGAVGVGAFVRTEELHRRALDAATHRDGVREEHPTVAEEIYR